MIQVCPFRPDSMLAARVTASTKSEIVRLGADQTGANCMISSRSAQHPDESREEQTECGLPPEDRHGPRISIARTSPEAVGDGAGGRGRDPKSSNGSSPSRTAR